MATLSKAERERLLRQRAKALRVTRPVPRREPVAKIPQRLGTGRINYFGHDFALRDSPPLWTKLPDDVKRDKLKAEEPRAADMMDAMARKWVDGMQLKAMPAAAALEFRDLPP